MPRKHLRGGGSRSGDQFWQEEQNNSGFKLMNKMGWSQGEGIGKSNNGRKEFVRASKKFDQGGIGHNKRKKDEEAFRATQGLFGDLLSRLNKQHGNSNGGTSNQSSSTSDDVKETNKSTTAAIKAYMANTNLYSKFRQSKDTNGYSKQDMSEIFGKSKKKSVEISYGENDPAQQVQRMI